jgi:predicted nucleic acid-binding protein
LTLVEVAAAIAAKSRAPNSISARHRERILERFLDDVAQQYLIIPLRHAIVDHAVHLTQIYRLRGYDAIQLATALVILSSLPPANRIHFRFVANDQDLLDAANAEGLHIDNPVQQP